MTPLPVPQFDLPFPTEENEAAPELARHAVAWVQQMGLIRSPRMLQRFEAGKFWYLVAHCFPHGASDVLRVVVEWDSWAFMLDDASEMGQQSHDPEAMRHLVEDLLRVLDGAMVSADPLFISLNDVWTHMQQWATPAWRSRFRASVAHTFAALVWEAENRAQGRIPDEESYRSWRRASSGLATHLDLADFTDAIALPDDIRSDPIVQQMTDHANNVISWTNDLYSLFKELVQQEVHNLVLVIAHEQDLSLPGAMQHVQALIREELLHFRRLKPHLPSVPGPIAAALDRYIRVLESWMRGNLDWSRATQRYTAPASQVQIGHRFVWSSLHDDGGIIPTA